jgi:hypothetical protein
VESRPGWIGTDRVREAGLKTMRSGDAVRRLMVGLTCLGAATLLDGCYRRHAPPTLPPVLQAPLQPPPMPAPPVMEGSLPEEITTASPVKVTQIRPRRPLRKPTSTTSKNPAAETPTPVDTAGAVLEDVPIGELSDGGDANPQTQQDAAGLIASSESRLNQLSPAIVRQQQPQLRRVRNFLRQAKQALSTGDAGGAKTLATKAKLLIDDLAK